MIKKNKVVVTSDLIYDLRKYAENFCVGMATQVRDDLYMQTTFAIGTFYMNYKPNYYKRHYYNFMDKSYKKYYSNPHNHLIRGGVELSYEYMDDIYQDDVKEVFDFVYHGFHGVSSVIHKTPTVMKPSPLDIIYKRRTYILNHLDRFYNKSYDRANSYVYKTIN